MLDFNTPKNIYSDIKNQIDSLLNNFKTASIEKGLENEFVQAMNTLEPIAQSLESEIAALEKNAEWDTFVLAFYGETNAGKSTIIETLRIILNEKSKVEEQNSFQQTKEKWDIAAKKYDELKNTIESAENFISHIQVKIDTLELNKKTKSEYDQIAISNLTNKISKAKEAVSWWKKFLNFFKNQSDSANSIELNQLKLNIAESNLAIDHELLLLKQESQEKNIAKQSSAIALKEIEGEKNHLETILEKYSDGSIIGNGKSDFTVNNKEYFFSNDNQNFILLDVPGIEGNENTVIDNIQNAVKKAHAVFYVTGKAAPPQKGDNGKKGTLEKIKEHLNSQTEIWTILNKRITNVVAIKDGLQIGVDEQASINDLNAKMTEQLGSNYKNSLTLSALPAFLATANCLAPNSEHSKKKEKFNEVLNDSDLLDKSQVNQLRELITLNLIKNSKNKIITANFTKAKATVVQATEQLNAILSQLLYPAQIDLKNQSENVQQQIQRQFDSLKAEFLSISSSSIDAYIQKNRTEIYSEIAQNISNGEFEATFKCTLKSNEEKLTSEIDGQIKEILKNFKSSLDKTIQRFEKINEEIYQNYSGNNNLIGIHFGLKINLKTGINYFGLVTTLIGGVAMFWNPVGWIEISLSAIGLILTVWKALGRLVSRKYKMSQQKETVEENLILIRNNLNSTIEENFENELAKIEPELQRLKSAMSDKVNLVTKILKMTEETKTHFIQIANKIDSDLAQI